MIGATVRTVAIADLDSGLGSTWDLGSIWDLGSTWGRVAVTVVVVAALLLLTWLLGRAAGRTFDDSQQSYNARRLVRTAAWLIGVVGLALVWRPLDGNLASALGLATAGVAFAMQEVIGAIAGWFNITFGSIFRVGDRIEMAGVHGDVIDISLLKTRMMEIGSAGGATWVQGRQYTGRVVTVSNKASFTGPVHNYSGYFEYIWEEIEVAVPHHGDWHAASRILEEEARRQSDSEGARRAMDEVRRRFPVPAAEVTPRVFASADESFMRLVVRFVVPIRNARPVKDAVTRRIYSGLERAGVEIVATSVIQTSEAAWQPVVPSVTPDDGPFGPRDTGVRPTP
ncbi:MAG: small-conductance mechanosensitive channel [Nitriliruptoraceae bacterium]